MNIKCFTINLALVIVLILGIIGCQDVGINIERPNSIACVEDCVFFRGQLTTGNGSSPLTDTKVQLYKQGLFFWVNPLGTTRTGDDGRYELSIPYSKIDSLAGKVALRITTNTQTYPLYGTQTPSKALDVLEAGESFNWDFFIPQSNMLKVRFEMPQPLKAGDRMALSAIFPYGEEDQTITNIVQLLGPSDSSVTFALDEMEIAANQEVRLERAITKDREKNISEEIINLTVGEKKTIVVVFE